ncbi:MAG: 4-amino-4-deoxychorismate lyase [Actinobacteria bacterium]|nr:4-amino-4-deoxychorismate lyase [Actinomycetota bacterium]
MWIDGALTPAADARISAVDHAITVGDGVFETVPLNNGTPFALGRHLARLRRSAEQVALDILWTDAEIRKAIESVAGTRDGLARLRITLTGGDSPLSSSRGSGQSRLIIATGPRLAATSTADVVTVPWTRNERGALAGVKSTSYGENVRSLRVAVRSGATEAIMANTQDQLCEGTGSNIVIEFQGRLVTPPLSSGCLAGVTRQLVLEVALESGAPIAEFDVPFSALRHTTEAFLTSSTRDVQPIATIDGKALRSAPGPLTSPIAAAFARLRSSKTDP